MNRKRKDDGPGSIVERLKTTEGTLCAAEHADLSQEDVDALTSMLRETDPSERPGTVKGAVALLARTKPSSESVAVLRELLVDGKVPVPVRLAAATALGRFEGAGETAERALLDAMDASDERVREEVVAALGRVGGPATLDRLAERGKASGTRERRLAAFTRRVVAHRLGDAEAAAGSGPGWRPLSVERLSRSKADARLAGLREAPWGIRVDRETAWSVPCGEAHLDVLLAEGLRRGDRQDALRAEPTLAGVVTTQDPVTGRPNVRRLILTEPDGDGFRVTVTRPDGTIHFAGRGRPTEKGVHIRLRDVGRERTPVEVEANLSDGGLDLSVRVWEGPLRPKRRARALTVPPA